MNLEELTAKINETFLSPEDMGFGDLSVESWLFLEDTRENKYSIYAIVPDSTVDVMEKERNTFLPLLSGLTNMQSLYSTLNIDKVGQSGFGNMSDDDYEFMEKIKGYNYSIIDFNYRESNNFLSSIMKLDLKEKPSKITIF